MAQDLLENQFKTQWNQLRGIARDKWLNLTQDDIQQINGSYELLVSKLQQRYGFTRMEAEDRIQSWIRERAPRSVSSERSYEHSSRTESPNRARESEGSSFLKWLLALGIPLLLLASYFAAERGQPTQNNPTDTMTRPMNSTMMAADQLINDNIRSAFMTNASIAPVASNIRVDTTNGVVTLNGSVSSVQQRELIGNTARNVSGVRDVVNLIEVK